MKAEYEREEKEEQGERRKVKRRKLDDGGNGLKGEG